MSGFLRLSRAGIAGILIVVLMGCERATPIPAGAQEVHITITESGVRLIPATVSAGDVYLVVDAPPDGSVTFVERKDASDATPGPMSDADLERLRRGDLQFTASSGLDAGGCSEAQNIEDRGKMGPCGNVMHVVVVPGKYAVLGDGPEADPATGSVGPIAVLEVVP